MDNTLPRSNFYYAVAIVAALGLAFQVGHFLEHAVQFFVWLLGRASGICGRDVPWMSPWVTVVVESFGAWAFPASDSARQMMLSMEILHIIGNAIFLTALVALYHVIGTKWVRWGIYIEAFHFYEHIMLTTTAFTLGKPVGLSTLFGGSAYLGSKEAAVGVRVTWHFFMNLFPMPFAMMGMLQHFRPERTKL